MIIWPAILIQASARTCACLRPQIINNADVTPGFYYSDEIVPRYQTQTTDLKNGVNNAALIGSVLGQVFFGIAGDLIGRKWCFVITSTLIILGALGSATASAGVTIPGSLNILGAWKDTSPTPASSYYDVYFQLYFWRGILGFGVGGEYPLASTITSESATHAQRGLAVLSIFSMQGWGKLTAAIVNYSLISTLQHYGGPWTLDSTWRFALAFGCVLNVLTIYFRWHLHESKIFGDVKKAELGIEDADALVIVESADVTPDHKKHKHIAMLDWRTTLGVLWEFKWVLLGTAGNWFLIDVTFYGQSLMNTTVVNDALNSTANLNSIDKLRTSLLSTVYIMLIALPGYWFAMALINKMGRYRMQQFGFLMSTICFTILAAAYNTPLRTTAGGAGFVIFYGLTYFFANFGPNSTTFLMPSEAFPTRARSTAHGLSAASGKIGATAGSFGLLGLFYGYCQSSRDPTGAPNCTVSGALQSEIDAGVVAVMAVCAAVSFGGNIWTTLFTKETGKLTLEEVDASSKVLAAHDAKHAAAVGASAVASAPVSVAAAGVDVKSVSSKHTVAAVEDPESAGADPVARDTTASVDAEAQ